MDKPKPKIPIITTAERPNTPPSSSSNAAPAIISTPPTPTERSSPRFGASPIRNNPNVVVSPSGSMISHRRMRSGSAASSSLGPSKLSSMTSAPLTPTPENGTPGGSNKEAQQSGFFSNVFSAAQTAANNLSNTITNTALPGQNRSRSGTNEAPITKPMDDVEVETPDDSPFRSNAPPKEPAVKTLGQGDLSLEALGISLTPQAANTPTTARFDDAYALGRSATVGTNGDMDRSGLEPPGLSVTSDQANAVTPAVDDITVTDPLAVYEPSVIGDQSPQNGSVFEGKTGRSNSIRSALGAPIRRHRGSSVATGTTVGAALAASTAANSVAGGPQPKVTGFAVASKKRNRDFHQLFKSVPEDDYLIEDYSCALQREILAHGRLYVSEGHLCFSSNIFGWVTTLVMSFDEIVSVEKRSTALLFKNGLMISTLHSKNVFASFASRDSTYDLIVGIWKLGHPSLRSSLNGVRIEEAGGGDKTEKDDGDSAVHSGSESGDGSDEEIYDEDEEYDDPESFEEGDDEEAGSESPEKPAVRKPTGKQKPPGGDGVAEKKDACVGGAVVDYPGPITHAPTECLDSDLHYEKVIADEVVQAPLGKIYNLMFGPASTIWLSNWLTNDMKCLELMMEEKRGLAQDNKTRVYSYIKPLYASIGPKSTKCITTEVLDTLDLDKCVSVTVSTQTPDVPSGNIFLTKTKYCLTWAEGNATRIQMNCAIEWSGKSWLKGPIEKGANDGQATYAVEIVKSLKSAVSSGRLQAGILTAGAKKRKGRKAAGHPKPKPTQILTKTEDWGMMEPLHPFLGPVIDIVEPLMSGNMVYGLLVGLLVTAWFGFGRQSPDRGAVGMGWSSAERVAAYEGIWRREEGELWEWLETRIGVQGTNGLNGLGINEASEDVRRGIEEKLGEETGSDVEVDEAIRVTEEKLNALKRVVDRRRTEGGGPPGGETSTKERQT